jgi:ABC-type uncharacterized transport system involved in gliding motility auxiliary subunit
MSRKTQFCLLIGFFILVVGAALKSLLGFDFPYSTQILWGVFAIFVGLAAYIERANLLDFLSLKTTKHGMNMGSAILLMMVLLIAINYISVSRDKKWDLTQEKLNSLSPQSIQIIRGLDKELKIIGFFKDDEPQIVQTKNVFTDIAERMKYENKKVTYEIYDPDKRPDLKAKYNVSAMGDVVIMYDGKQKLVSIINMLQPEQAEETLINNVFILSTSNGKAVYFLAGHNEMDINNEASDGISYLKKSLTDLNYEVKTLNLLQTDKIPDDAKMIIIAAPKTPIYDGEIKVLREYAENGGHILVAVDPGEKSNIQKLAEIFGVDFKNNYLIDFAGVRVGGSQYLAVGLSYPEGKSNITKGFRANTNFNIASEVGFKDEMQGIAHEIIVGSSPQTLVRNVLSENIDVDPKKEKPYSRNIGVLTEGKLPNAKKDFKFILYGDSNFINNNDVQVSILNRDLILNSIAYLADQKELISVRPKKLKLSAFFMTPTQSMIMKYCLYLMIPFLFLTSSITLWYRRRHA